MAWGFVQANAAAGTATTSASLAITSACSAGNLIVVCAHIDSTTRSISTVTDSVGNTYTNATTLITATGLGRAQIWYAKNIASGTPTVTVTYDATLGGGGYYIGLAEYSGLDTTAPLDVVATNAVTTNSASMTSTPNTTTAANDLLLGFFFCGGTGAADAGFNSRLTTNGDVVEDKDSGSSGSSVAATGTQSPSRPYIGLMATFKAASGGGSSATPGAIVVPNIAVMQSSY